MKDDSLEYLTEHRQSEGFRFSLSPLCPQPDKLVALVTGHENPDRYFKQGRRRNVMLLDNMVVKFYEFHRFSDLLHSNRYATREVECYHDYVKAFGFLEGFQLPKLYGYFEKPLFGHFYRANGIVDEYMPNMRELTVQELMIIPPLFVHLYRKGIYHPDMQLKNVLFNPTTRLLVPIDYMGCNFLPKPSWEALLIEMAHFLHTGNVEEEKGRAFVNAVLESIPELRLNREKAWNCITQLWKLRITTHQYHHPIFLPSELKRQTQPDE